MRQRHGVLSFVASVSEHDSLVTCTNVEVILANMHTTSDIRALLVNTNEDLTRLVGEAHDVNAAKIVNI